MIYIFNLTIQNFINTFDFEIFNETKINELNEKQIQNIKKNTNLFVVIKKIIVDNANK